ncbi:TPA: hypothetical protein I7730_14135 [Vibrio vulnificus]|uniref:Uncharacterized protein n=1 Tax=Vibrio vulnificus TaxID=672 RepID=A0A8H9TG71_VIBVL|nr:hypothetical protein [Vibrio vulnificus]HAS8540925.1 hypothetical protein [Vibrio vulnificus]
MSNKSIDEILELEAFEYLNRLFAGSEGFFLQRGEQWVKVAGGKTADGNNWESLLSNLSIDFVVPKDVMEKSIRVFKAMSDVGVQIWDGLPLVDIKKTPEENAEEFCWPSIDSVIKVVSPLRSPEETNQLIKAIVESQTTNYSPSNAVKRTM